MTVRIDRGEAYPSSRLPCQVSRVVFRFAARFRELPQKWQTYLFFWIETDYSSLLCIFEYLFRFSVITREIEAADTADRIFHEDINRMILSSLCNYCNNFSVVRCGAFFGFVDTVFHQGSARSKRLANGQEDDHCQPEQPTRTLYSPCCTVSRQDQTSCKFVVAFEFLFSR